MDPLTATQLQLAVQDLRRHLTRGEDVGNVGVGVRLLTWGHDGLHGRDGGVGRLEGREAEGVHGDDDRLGAVLGLGHGRPRGIDRRSITFFLVIVSTILGTWATAQLQPYWGEDPSRVVIDEMAGVWIPLSLLTPLTAQGEVKDAWWWALVALVLFRFFDMVKPLGIKKLDNRQGAFYVMADDLLGGFYAAVSLIIIKIILVSAGII